MDWTDVQEFLVRKEPPPCGDQNILNEPMRDESRGMYVCGNSYTNSGEETILGLPSDVSVPNERNVYEDFPMDCVPPVVLSSQLCSRDLTESPVKFELNNINVNLSSEYLDPVEPAADTHIPLLQSEFNIKIVDETLLSVDNDLISENDEFSENTSERNLVSSVSDLNAKVVCTDRKEDCSGAASGCFSESYSPQEPSAACLNPQRIECVEAAVGLMPRLPAEVNPRNSPTHPSHTTPVCEIDISVIGGRNPTGRHCCPICNKTFTHNSSLSVHMRFHAEDRLIRSECNNSAETSITLNKESWRKLYACTVCGFKSVHPKSLREHTRTHSGVRPYKCTECGYTSAYSSHLKKHKQTHCLLKPYKCSECGYAAAQLGAFVKHQQIHVGVKPYKCTECEFTSAYSNHLKRHQQTHGGVTPYKCTECEYTSAYSFHLKIHQRTHSRLNP